MHPQIIQRIVDKARLEVRRLRHEAAGRHHLIADELRLKCSQIHPFSRLELGDYVIKDPSRQRQILQRALPIEDAAINLQAGYSYLYLVRKTAQEGRIHQVFRLQVGRKNDQLLEGDAKALSCMQFQKIDAALQRDDPAVEQAGWARILAAKVIDDEAAAQRLQVQWRLVVMACRVIAQIEHLQRQLAAGGDERPAAWNPARVVFLGPDEREVFVVQFRGTQF